MKKHITPLTPAFPQSAEAASFSTPDAEPALPHDGWTLWRQRQFCEYFAEKGNVEKAAASVGMTGRSAYRFSIAKRGRAFAGAWRIARGITLAFMAEESLNMISQGISGKVTTTRFIHRPNKPPKAVTKEVIKRYPSDPAIFEPIKQKAIASTAAIKANSPSFDDLEAWFDRLVPEFDDQE
jgi:hypothetical protein